MEHKDLIVNSYISCFVTLNCDCEDLHYLRRAFLIRLKSLYNLLWEELYCIIVHAVLLSSLFLELFNVM